MKYDTYKEAKYYLSFFCKELRVKHTIMKTKYYSLLQNKNISCFVLVFKP